MSFKYLLNSSICLHNNDNNNVSSESDLITLLQWKFSFLSKHRLRKDLAQLLARRIS